MIFFIGILYSPASIAGKVKGIKHLVEWVSPRNLKPTQSQREMTKSRTKKLERDMRENGFDPNEPILGHRNNKGQIEIEDGHHRRDAAINAGIDKVPVDVIE